MAIIHDFSPKIKRLARGIAWIFLNLCWSLRMAETKTKKKCLKLQVIAQVMILDQKLMIFKDFYSRKFPLTKMKHKAVQRVKFNVQILTALAIKAQCRDFV